jgi:hypothetical protein
MYLIANLLQRLSPWLQHFIFDEPLFVSSRAHGSLGGYYENSSTRKFVDRIFVDLPHKYSSN